MQLTSVFINNSTIPSKYTCDGEDVNSPLNISDVPPEAKSLVLIVDDPDAPKGTWTHWVVVNIDPKTDAFQEDSVPPRSLQTITSFGKLGWGGPCPPSGMHHYHFKLYALDIEKLDVSGTAEVKQIIEAMAKHIISATQLIGLYQRGV